MKLLVTGSKGQLAKEIIKISSNLNHELQTPGKKKLDITNLDLVLKSISDFRPDVVINCAAFNNVDLAEKKWKKAYMVNGIGVKNLAIACSKYDAVLLHFSTDYVFDGRLTESYTIADRPCPINKYGKSKQLGEFFLQNYLDRHYLIRTSWVFGDGKHSFPNKLLDWKLEKKTLRIVDDQISSPTYSEDLATAVIKLITTDNFGTYHITNSGHCSRYEWAKFILDRTDWKGKLEKAKSSEFDTAARRPLNSVLDNFPLQESLDFKLPSWQEATEKFLKNKS